MENKQRVYRKLIWRERPKDLLKDFKKIIEVIVKRYDYYMLEGVSQALEQMSLDEFRTLVKRLNITAKDMRDLVLNRYPRSCSDLSVLESISDTLTLQMALQDYRRITIKWAKRRRLRSVIILEEMPDKRLLSFKEGGFSPTSLAYRLNSGFLDGTKDWTWNENKLKGFPEL